MACRNLRCAGWGLRPRGLTLVLGAVLLGSIGIASPANAQEEGERSALVTGDTPVPFGFNYGELDTTRSGGMSGALRAAGNGTTAIFLNPAAMTLTRIYHIEAIANVTPEFGRLAFGSAVVDSITNKLAGGISVSGGWLDSFSDPATSLDRNWLDVRLALAYPIVDAFSIGLGGRYMKVTQSGVGPLDRSKVSGGLMDPEGDGRLSLVNTATFDAGVSIKAGELLRIGVSGQNLTYLNDGIMPTLIGGGLGIAHEDFTIEADGVADLTSYATPTARVMAGGEYLIVDRVPVRLGYRFDQGANSHQLSGGLGYQSNQFMIEASVRRTLVGPEATEVIFGAAYFLESSGLTGTGAEP